MFMLHWGVFIYVFIPHPFCQKMSTYLDRAKQNKQKKKVKSLKFENFYQTSKKQAPPNSGQF